MLKDTNSSFLRTQVDIWEVSNNVILEYNNIFWTKWIQTHTENIIINNYNRTTTLGIHACA